LQDERTVTIAYTESEARLLGNLQHNTTLLVDQALVDDLQALVDFQKGSQ
jgi:hypothetical protein